MVTQMLCTVFIKPEQHMVYGGKNIKDIIKRGEKEIPLLVKDHGLVAWQNVNNGQWRALMADLLEFNLAEKDRNFNPVNS